MATLKSSTSAFWFQSYLRIRLFATYDVYVSRCMDEEHDELVFG